LARQQQQQQPPQWMLAAAAAAAAALADSPQLPLGLRLVRRMQAALLLLLL
jgi:hypothetical protein